jgi:hypothetical protein
MHSNVNNCSIISQNSMNVNYLKNNGIGRNMSIYVFFIDLFFSIEL